MGAERVLYDADLRPASLRLARDGSFDLPVERLRDWQIQRAVGDCRARAAAAATSEPDVELLAENPDSDIVQAVLAPLGLSDELRLQAFVQPVDVEFPDFRYCHYATIVARDPDGASPSVQWRADAGYGGDTPSAPRRTLHRGEAIGYRVTSASDAAPVLTDGKTARWSDAVWQRGFTMVPNSILLDTPLGAAAFRVFVVLSHLSWRPEDEWPGQDKLAELAQCSPRTLRTALHELREAQLVETKQRGQGMTNVYVLTIPPRTAKSAGLDSSPVKSAALEVADSAGLSLLVEDLEQDKRDPSPVESVTTAWTDLAPPLIRHPDGVLRSEKVKRAINGALRVYAAEDVVAAIRNYATVLAGSEYRWSYRWTLKDFLARGLDRFVPDAAPLENFRTDSPSTRDRRFDELDRL